MKNIDITEFSKDTLKYINEAVEFDNVIKVCTNKGNAIIISEKKYNDMLSLVDRDIIFKSNT